MTAQRACADCFDAANANFMFNQLPYIFGSGCCFITGAPRYDCRLRCCSPVHASSSMHRHWRATHTCTEVLH